MEKIIVIGCPGSGKSTFSAALNKITGIPLIHLDMLYWNKDKTTVEKAVFMERLSKVLQTQSFIIDGNYASTMELRIIKSDTVIFLDYPKEVCLQGVAERMGKPRSDMPWVETEIDKEFIEFIKKYNEQCKPQVEMLLEKYSNKKIIILKSRAEADLFLSKIKEKGIKNV